MPAGRSERARRTTSTCGFRSDLDSFSRHLVTSRVEGEAMKASRRISPLFRSGSIAMVAVVLAVVLAASPAWGLRVGTLRYPHHTTGVPNAEPGVTTDTVDCPADHPVATG